MNSNTVNNISNNEKVRDLEHLNKIRDTVFTPCKYDSCMACINPCLASDKLEDAKHYCFTGECNTCGFRILWSLGIRRALF